MVYLGRGRSSRAGAGQVELLALGDGGLERGDGGRGGRQQHHQLDHRAVQLPTSPKLNVPTLEVSVVSLVARVFDPEVVATQLRLVLHPAQYHTVHIKGKR